MFVGHSRIRAGHACRIVCLKACTTGLRGLHGGLVRGDRIGNKHYCASLRLGVAKGRKRRVKTRTEGGG